MSARERIVAVALIVTALASIGFIVVYATSEDRRYEGLTIAVAFAGLAGAAALWSRWLIPGERVVDRRDEYPSPAALRANENREARAAGGAVTRRRALTRLLLVAAGSLGAALIVPFRSLGPSRGFIDTGSRTKWRPGSRMIRPDGSLVRANDLASDSVVTVFPEGALGDAQSQVMLIRLPSGYVAYSKVCTHAGCPVALYRAEAKQLMCPCHQSVFDVVDDGRVVSGPADRALPRLPVHVNAGGYVVATEDFSHPVGPASWEQG